MGTIRQTAFSAACALALLACKSHESNDLSSAARTASAVAPAASGTARAADPSPSSTASAKGVTITLGPNGEATVSGADDMTGDPKACAAFKACCAARELSLFCGMTRASETDCGKALAAVRAQIDETKLKPPPGCR